MQNNNYFLNLHQNLATMRQLFLLTCVVLLIIGTTRLNGQQLKNSDFENWQTVKLGENPNQWFVWMGNLSPFYDTPLVRKTTDAYRGNYALHLKSVTRENEVQAGYVNIYDTLQKNVTKRGLIPFEGRPDSLTGFAKYEIQSGVNAVIRLVFKLKTDTLIGATKYFSGNQSNYERFSMPINLPAKADSLFGRIDVSFGSEKAGNSLKLDALKFKGISGGAKFPNGGFENWRSITADKADEWSSRNFFYTYYADKRMLTKTTDAQSGNYAARLENVSTYDGDNSGYMNYGGSSGYYDDPRSDLPLNNKNPEKITGYYKYLPQGQDSAIMGYNLKHYQTANDTLVTLESNGTVLPPTNSYTKFEMKVDYDSSLVADSFNLAFLAGNGLPGKLGSELFIDNIKIHYPDGSGKVNRDEPEFEVYPVPAEDQITISPLNIPLRQYRLTSITGQTLKKGQISGDEKRTIDFSNLSPGVYLLEVKAKNFLMKKKVVVK